MCFKIITFTLKDLWGLSGFIGLLAAKHWLSVSKCMLRNWWTLKVKVKVRRVLKSDYRDHEESIISSTANFTIHLIVFQSYTSVKSNPKRRSIWLGNQKSPSPRIQHVKSKNVGRSDWVTKNRPRLDLNPGLQHEKRLTYWLSQGARLVSYYVIF